MQKLISIVVLLLASIVFFILWAGARNDVGTLSNKLVIEEAILTQVESALKATQSELGTVKLELEDIRKEQRTTKSELHDTQEELAARLKLDRSTIANLIRLLELPEPVQDAIRRRRITQGHARALLPLGEEREQIEFCQRIQHERLNVRQTEALVQELIEAADAAPLAVVDGSGRRARSPRPKSEHLLSLEQELRAALGMKVKVTHNARGRGKLTIHFRNHEEFERLRRQLTDPARLDVRVG